MAAIIGGQREGGQVSRPVIEEAPLPISEPLHLRQPDLDTRSPRGSWRKQASFALPLPCDKSPQPERQLQKKSAGDKLEEIPLDLIVSNPYQPRRKFDQQKLMDLSQSIRQLGVLEPIILREVGKRYELVAGERRVKASRLAGNRTIPALVRDLSDQEALEIALIENLQRENLNPVERAEAYQRISKEFLYLTPDQLASRVAKEQGEIVEDLRLMKLPLVAQKALVEQVINREEAEEILGIPEPSSQLSALELVVRKKMRKKVDSQ
ncbi:MAG: ParB/RepB/Spo0J family partition protein [Armatimonadetes bacterium]|nr:ParB/RepB/Spo0J family partition protein [Armatimonadota bacterium]